MSFEEIKAALAVAVVCPNNFEVFRLLDQLNTLEELDAVKPILGTYVGIFPFYEGWIKQWPRPALSDEFVAEYPRVSKLLDEQWKVRVFLRAAQFRQVNSMVMGDVFEDILSQRHSGKDRVVYPRYRGDRWCDALRIVYHTQVQAETLRKILIPDARSFGVSSVEGLFIEWPKTEESVAAVQVA
jgi:hypothetical protein